MIISVDLFLLLHRIIWYKLNIQYLLVKNIMVHQLNSQNNDEQDDNPDSGTITKLRPKTKKPSMYKVLMLNDDYTPMEFVVYVLESFFGKSQGEANKIMLNVHQKGVGVCGLYTYEVAETKVNKTMSLALKHQHPLQCTLEKD